MNESNPFDAFFESPVGYLGLRMRGDALAGITFLGKPQVNKIMPSTQTGPVLSQLDHYFSDPDYRFSLPLDPVGSSFQKRVWWALCDIGPGTITYGDLARHLGTAARAIGHACRANPIPIVIPCHRVIAARGCGGYMGRQEQYLAIKRWLLAHERGC